MPFFATSFKLYWNYLVGEPSGFSLESRIFNSFCIIALAAIAYEIPFNYFIGLPVSALLSVILLFCQFFLYYLSRFKRKHEISFPVSAVLIHLIIIVNYFYNSGIQGPSLILLVLSFFLIIAIAPPQQYLAWVLINLLVVVFLLSIEYFFPALVLYTYGSRSDLFTDSASSYLVTIVLIYVGTSYIRNNYNKERNDANSRAMEMERLNTEKNKLLSIISHDLRAPLTTIQYYLELLTRIDLEPEEKLKFKSELLQITRNTQNMLHNLLSWSKSQLNGQNIHLVQVNTSEILMPVLEVQKVISRQKGIELSCRINPSEIVADRDMFQLVVRNILSNAIKFTHPGGKIKVTTEELEGHCIISIKDNGIGIPAERQQDLFSLKAQPTYGTIHEKGVGLGLALCKDFTEAQNGRLWFESKENEGSVFYIRMPLYKPDEDHKY